MIESKSGTEEIKDTLSAGINDLLEMCRTSGFAFAIWRVPGRDAEGIMDVSATAVNDIELENTNPGFYFHPYSKKHQRHFIKADVKFKIDKGQIYPGEDLHPEIESWLKQAGDSNHQKKADREAVITSESDGDKAGFIELVKNAQEAIGTGMFQKVVPSRRKKVFTGSLNFDQVFDSLTSRYPNAFVSITYIPDAGLWIGASPEILVHTSQGKLFETVALAGTQPLLPGQSLRDVAWRQKEIEEQAYVSRYIINCFKKIRLREFTEIGPKTVTAGNLIHLKTSFRVNMEEVNFPQLGSVMLDLLHPTSAVCGMPMDSASEWLEEHEGYDRSYFSGYLGPVNMNGDTSLYVNLRCMNFDGDHAWIYAGAGVTEDSTPEKEWEETSIKMNTLLDIIR